MESIQDAFALFDERDRLVLCNSVYRRLIGSDLPGPLVGRTSEELIDAWIGDIVFPEGAAASRASHAASARCRSVRHGEIRSAVSDTRRRSPGSPLW